MLLIADPGPAAIAAEQAIEDAGDRLLQRVAWADLAALLPRLATIPLLVAEAQGLDPRRLDDLLPLIARFLVATEAKAVVSFDHGAIDLVAGHLLGPSADLLCDPTFDQRVTALRSAARRVRPVLHDTVPDSVQTDRASFDSGAVESDEQRLRRLTEAMAHISRLAGDYSRSAVTPPRTDVADRRRGFDSEPAAAGYAVAPQEVRRIIFRRRQRGKFFGQFGGEALFEDPAWDMLLDLFASELEGTRVSVSSLCIAAGVAPTTALRWIAKMTELDLLIRHPDLIDKRRAYITLSPRATEAMRGYMLAIRKTDTSG